MSLRTAISQGVSAFKREIVGGVSGTEIYGGYINAEPNTILTDVKWDDDQRYKHVDEMLLDGVVESVQNAIELPIKAAEATVEPASDDKRDEEIANALRQDLLENPNFSWRELIEPLLTFLPYGNVVMWKSFEKAERMRWSGWHFRHPNTLDQWDISNDGKLWRVHQCATKNEGGSFEGWLPEKRPTGSIDHPLFHMAYKQIGDNFKGKSSLRQAWRPYVMKREFMMLLAGQGQLAGLGIPKAIFKNGMPKEGTPEYTQAVNALKNVRGAIQNFIMTSDTFDVGVYGGKELGDYDFLPKLYYLDQQIAAPVLASFLEQGKNAVGSFAKQESDIGLFLDNLEGIANDIEAVFNRGRRGMQHIRQWADLNFAETQSKDFVYPKLRLAKVNNMNLETWAGIINTFVGAGLFLDDEDWNVIRERSGFKEVDIEELQRRAEPPEEEENTNQKRSQFFAGLKKSAPYLDDTTSRKLNDLPYEHLTIERD